MRIVTVTDPGFFRGTRVLISSILRNGGLNDPSFLVLHEGLDETHARQIADLGAEAEFRSVAEVANFQVPPNRLPAHKRLRLKKLGIFAASPGETLVYFDSDMLCVGPLTNLMSMDHFTASPDLGYRAFRSVHGYPMFNSGFMVFRSSLDLFDRLQTFATSDHFAGKADQFLINEFMYGCGEPVRIAHSRYNLPVSTKYSNPKLFRDFMKQGCGMLHFTNLKPWALRRTDLPKKKDEVRNWMSVLRAREEYRMWFRSERNALS